MNAPLSFATRPALSRAEPLIRFEAVSKAFPGRADAPAVAALHGIDLSVRRGTIMGVIGRSGAGKSTLVRLVNGLEKPSSGRVLVDDVDVATLNGTALRQTQREIGMIFQHFNLLSSRTVFDNVAFPLEIAGASRTEILQRVDPLLDLVGLSDKRDRYPAELSGGQKQRVGIARALATKPKALLSDEATSALDPETTRSILDLLGTVNRDLGVTILLITHEMSVIRAIANEVAVLEAGSVVEYGEVFDIFTQPSHPTTQSFLAAEAGRHLPAWLKAKLLSGPVNGGQTIMRITFRGRFAKEAVLSQLARDLQVDINVLSGTIDSIAGKPFGWIITGMPGDEPLIERARNFLTQRGLGVEVLGHVA